MSGPDISEIGEALYGPRWQSELARDYGINLRTMQRWASGQGDAPPTLYMEIADDMEQRAVRLTKLSRHVRKYVAAATG